MERQRLLEGCNWEFCRIRESSFYADREHELASLWRKLEERGITPNIPQTLSNIALENVNSNDGIEMDRAEISNCVIDDEDGDSALGDSYFDTQTKKRPEDISSSEIADSIINVLQKCPKHSCTLHSLTSRVLKTIGIRTRGKPREKFDNRVMRIVNNLASDDRIKKYKSKNHRIRLPQSPRDQFPYMLDTPT